MAQLNVYLPNDIDTAIRKAAKKQRQSLSAFLASLVKSYLSQAEWQKNFFTKVAGQWQGDFPAIKRELPEKIDFS